MGSSCCLRLRVSSAAAAVLGEMLCAYTAFRVWPWFSTCTPIWKSLRVMPAAPGMPVKVSVKEVWGAAVQAALLLCQPRSGTAQCKAVRLPLDPVRRRALLKSRMWLLQHAGACSGLAANQVQAISPQSVCRTPANPHQDQLLAPSVSPVYLQLAIHKHITRL